MEWPIRHNRGEKVSGRYQLMQLQARGDRYTGRYQQKKSRVSPLRPIIDTQLVMHLQ